MAHSVSLFTVITHLLYELVLTGVGHSAANMPSNRSAMPPAKSGNLAPFMSTGGQRETTSSVDMEMDYCEFVTVIMHLL